ncbi:hypothetical protein VEE15_33370 [Escherichia coli]|nr:hypothetical protein VEE15_33370 [Escherichia coli]
MFLDYFALGVLIFVFLVIFYGIIILHDIPYLIAKKRNHPHADAIHVAGLGESFYVTCYLAVFVDLGHALPPGAGMGNAKP